MWTKRLLGSVLLLTLLAIGNGCATLQGDLDTIHAKLQGVVQADLDAALAAASRPMPDGSPVDPAGVQCFTALKVLAGKDAMTLPEVKGALSAIEAARSIRLGVQGGDIAEQINLACAAWYMSVKGQVMKLAVEVAGFMK